MSHSFWMSADVHLLLDLHDRTWLQLFSCWLHQYCNIHLSRSLSHLIWVCSSPHSVECLFGLGCWSCDHASRCVRRVSHSTGSVPCAHSHCFSFSMFADHCCLAFGSGQRKICCLSSISARHQGHSTKDLRPHRCMFFPCANCPVICLDTHHHLVGCASEVACSIASVSTSFSDGDRCESLECQYCCAGGPLRA